MENGVRASLVHGIFYPEEPAELRRMLEDGIVEPAENKGPMPAVPALVLPHAAYEYVLPHILRGFSLLRRSGAAPRRFFIAAGLHRERKEGIILPRFDACATPLGDVRIDTDAVRRIAGNTSARLADLPFSEEHSFEVLLPPAAHFFPEASVVPVLAGDVSEKTAGEMTGALQTTMEECPGETIVLIVSNSTAETDAKNAELQGQVFEETLTRPASVESPVSAESPATPASPAFPGEEPRGRRLLELAREGRVTACGASAIAALMRVLPHGRFIELSAGSSRRGDEPREVRYGAFAYIGTSDEEDLHGV
jgi:hypothetical protein